jgi:hypothetical protein
MTTDLRHPQESLTSEDRQEIEQIAKRAMLRVRSMQSKTILSARIRACARILEEAARLNAQIEAKARRDRD